VESRVEWLKRQILTIECELKELREGGYNAHAHPGRARRLATLLNSHRRELFSASQITIEYRRPIAPLWRSKP
jgi:molybdopterin synthase catalytic subunit